MVTGAYLMLLETFSVDVYSAGSVFLGLDSLSIDNNWAYFLITILWGDLLVISSIGSSTIFEVLTGERVFFDGALKYGFYVLAVEDLLVDAFIDLLKLLAYYESGCFYNHGTSYFEIFLRPKTSWGETDLCYILLSI